MIEWGPKCTDSSHSVSIGIIGDYVEQIHKPETERDGKYLLLFYPILKTSRNIT